MAITATLINYYHVCKRKLWLFVNGIQMEHTSDTVYDGKLLHEESFPKRASKYSDVELYATLPTASGSIDVAGKIDFFDYREKQVHETKLSDRLENAHEWQLKFYLWLLELKGVQGANGMLEYPKIKEKKLIWLSDPDREYLKQAVDAIVRLQNSDHCPPRIEKKMCKSCSYYELCYVAETD